METGRGDSQVGLTPPSGWPCPHWDPSAQLNQDNRTNFES